MNKKIDEKEEIRRGDMLAEILNLKRDSDYPDRYKTTWGTKSALGVYLVAKRIISEGK